MVVARIVEQQQAICAVFAEDCKHCYKMPTDTEYSTLEAIVKVLSLCHTLHQQFDHC